MNVTAAEEWMYRVMKAVYDSGIPVDFKGSMVLRACLMEAGYSEEIRHTVDIDGDWYWEAPPSAGQLTQALQRALQKSGIELDVSLYRMYGEGRSAGFELTERSSGDVLFSMDIDINRPMRPTKIYEVGASNFGAPPRLRCWRISCRLCPLTGFFGGSRTWLTCIICQRCFPLTGSRLSGLCKTAAERWGTFTAFCWKRQR